VSLGIFFPWLPPTEPCALGSTQPLKMRTRDFSWGKGGRCLWLTTYHSCSAETSRKFGALNYPEPLGPPRPVAGWPLPLFILHLLNICSDTWVWKSVRERLSGPFSTGPEVRPAFCKLGKIFLSRGLLSPRKRHRGEALTTHPLLLPG